MLFLLSYHPLRSELQSTYPSRWLGFQHFHLGKRCTMARTAIETKKKQDENERGCPENLYIRFDNRPLHDAQADY
jgi:hypothetical protein